MSKKFFIDENIALIHDDEDFPGFIKIRVIKNHIYELISKKKELTIEIIEELSCDEVMIPKNTLIKYVLEEFIKPQKIEAIKKMSIIDFLYKE